MKFYLVSSALVLFIATPGIAAADKQHRRLRGSHVTDYSNYDEAIANAEDDEGRRAAYDGYNNYYNPGREVARERGYAFGHDEQKQSSTPAWHKLASNVNYRITAILDVNGGASATPVFDETNGAKFDDSSTDSVKTPGYSIPIDVLTLQDPQTKVWRQRISYYSGVKVDYNNNGEGFKVISTPYTGQSRTAERLHDPKKMKCMLTGGGNSTVDKQKEPYLNFFPTLEQMKMYTLGKLVTTEPGIPYRVASLEAAHGSFNETSDYTQPDASYDAHPGMPTNDWFQFTYQEGLTADTSNSARPLKWTMLSRNQIINAHTENWVLRYLSYEAIDTDDERKLWESYFDMNIQKDCGDEKEQLVLESDRHMLKLNRLGMFFSSTSSHSTDTVPEDNDSSAVSQFDLFLAQHNKHYTRDEYAKRKEIHETNTRNIVKWNKEHAGKTTFAPHEFMDMEVKEVMSFRGGHIPGGKAKIGRRSNDQDKKQLRQSSAPDVALEPHFLEGFNIDEDSFTTYELPIGFDPTTLPASFDWREYLPGAVGAVKDQGICGSCWAFAFISAMESHWFITHGQAVDLPEQFVNDCAWGEGTHACDGGDASYAAKQIIERFQGVIPTRNAYGGYLSVDAECFVDVLQDIGMMNEDFSTTELPSSNTVKLTDYVLLPTRDDIATKHALYTQGPLSIAINVVDEAIYYSSGVLDVASCTNNGEDYLDHAVTVVGWGTDQLPDGTKAEHWIMRNSWSDLWGNAGYFRIRMGERDCGVTTKPGYPVVLPKEQSTVDVPLTIIAATS